MVPALRCARHTKDHRVEIRLRCWFRLVGSIGLSLTPGERKTTYAWVISSRSEERRVGKTGEWSSDVCSSDLLQIAANGPAITLEHLPLGGNRHGARAAMRPAHQGPQGRDPAEMLVSARRLHRS